MSKPVCAVVGVGPGNGAALARRFSADGYAVALLSRSTDFSSSLASDLPDAKAYACDATDPHAVDSTFRTIEGELGPTQVLLYNAGSGVFGTMDEVGVDDLQKAWKVNCQGLFAAAKAVTPKMKEQGRGAIVVTGATASLRGGARFAAFAQAKAAQRNLAQSMARHLWPHGIHVGLLIVDGVVDLERTRKMMPDRPDDQFMQPDAIAQAAAALVAQPPSAWTFELDLRPHVETW